MSEQFRILLSDKKVNMTSFSSLGEYKRMYKGEKVGHAGTLDSFASGLMIVMVGGATKLNPIFSSFGKRYIAEIGFGSETDTLDPTGRIVRTSDVIPTEDEIKAVLPSFLGKQKQIPPVYSAVHVDGKRAYKEARKERDIKMPERDIEIKDISLISVSGDRCIIDCTVSKGTYIRSLARDIALSLGSCGHLENLRRLEIGPFSLSDIKLTTDELLEKTGLFGKLYFSSRHRKEIDNGTVKREWIIAHENDDRPFSYMYIDDNLYGYMENGEKLKVMARCAG